MRYRADLTMSDPTGRVIAAVEVKRSDVREQRDVEEYLARLAAYSSARGASVLLLAFPDRLFVARSPSSPSESTSEVVAEIDARPLWRPYLDRAGIDPEKVTPKVFEMIVEQYFEDIASGSGPAAEQAVLRPTESLPGWLVEALRDATVTSGVGV